MNHFTYILLEKDNKLSFGKMQAKIKNCTKKQKHFIIIKIKLIVHLETELSFKAK